MMIPQRFGITQHVAEQEILLHFDIGDQHLIIELSPDQAMQMGRALQLSAQDIAQKIQAKMN